MYNLVTEDNVHEYIDVGRDSPHAKQLSKWGERTGVAMDEALPVGGVGCWGDSAVYNTRDSLYVLLWNVVTGIHHHRHVFAHSLNKLYVVVDVMVDVLSTQSGPYSPGQWESACRRFSLPSEVTGCCLSILD